MKLKLIAILFALTTIVFWVICYTLPTWLVWNCVISPKFTVPQFTFAETFFVLSIIKFIFSSTDYRKLYNDIRTNEKR
jgi:hypothetical protein